MFNRIRSAAGAVSMAILSMAAVMPISMTFAQEAPRSPSPGAVSAGVDKSGDAELQSLIEAVVPKFIQKEYQDPETGLAVPYNLYVPESAAGSDPLPLVYFIADSSVVGQDVTTPLTQGYGGLIWASPEDQAEHPSFVLVPQFPRVIIDDHGAFTTTEYVDLAARLVEAVAAQYNVDTDRLYGTGQSMGCMTMMLISARNPELFAAQWFVSGQWDVTELGSLADQTFFYTAAAGDAKASQGQVDLLAVLTREGAEIGSAHWDATWPEAEMKAAVEELLAPGNDINFATFTEGSVMPEGVAAPAGSGEHMYSFDPAYQIDALRDWVFEQSK